MNVKQLKERLNDFPDDMYVFVDIDFTTQEGYQFQLVASVREEVIQFGSHVDKTAAKDKCAIIELT